MSCRWMRSSDRDDWMEWLIGDSHLMRHYISRMKKMMFHYNYWPRKRKLKSWIICSDREIFRFRTWKSNFLSQCTLRICKVKLISWCRKRWRRSWNIRINLEAVRSWLRSWRCQRIGTKLWLLFFSRRTRIWTKQCITGIRSAPCSSLIWRTWRTKSTTDSPKSGLRTTYRVCRLKCRTYSNWSLWASKLWKRTHRTSQVARCLLLIINPDI